MTRLPLPAVVALALVAVAAVAAAVAVVVVPHLRAEAVASPRATRSSTATPTPTPTPVGPARVVTIGDSIMAGYGLRAGQAWPALLAVEDRESVANLSCSGAGFIAVGECGTAFDGLIDQAVAANPQLVIIQSSDNDVDEDSAELAQATTATVATIRQRLPHARIVGFGTLWDQPGVVPGEIAESSDDLKAAVTAAGGVYLDLGQPLAGEPTLLQSDSEHPTAAGQQVLAGVIRRTLLGAGIRI
ncbi:SGNH/GDSL hydrolase family protein [Pseudolysinimonas sp.]|uniref:SGNH/GDSL hydrolase family protein n=1 Tax=Pseudolysinimonas sp. TaxID=2680009 RepID=UPI003F816CE0